MKNTSLITQPKTMIMRVSDKPSRKLNYSEDALLKFQEVYNAQQEIIHELRLENVELRKEIMLLERTPKLIETNVTEITPKEEKERRLQPIGYDKLKELSGYLYNIFSNHVDRVKYRDALVHMLYTLYKLNGEASPTQLFYSADLVEVTGFRYANFLKRARFVEFSPTNKKGYYLLTDLGKQFIQGKIKTEETFCELIGIENINLWS